MAGSNVVYSYLIGEESTYGTGVTTDKDIGIVRDVSGGVVREAIISAGVSDIEPNANHSGIEEGQHQVLMEYQHGRIFEFIIGTASHVQSSSDYSHTFAVDNEPGFFSASTGINLSGGDAGQKYTGCMIESAEVSIELNGLLIVSYKARGIAPSVLSTVPAHSVSSLPVFPHSLVTVKFNTVTATQVQNFSVSFNKKFEPVNGITSNAVLGMKAVELRVEFSGTLVFSDTTYHTHAISNNLTAIDFEADNGVAFGSGKRAFDLALNDIEVTSFTEVEKMGGLVVCEIGGIAKINSFVTYDNIAGASWI